MRLRITILTAGSGDRVTDTPEVPGEGFVFLDSGERVLLDSGEILIISE